MICNTEKLIVNVSRPEINVFGQSGSKGAFEVKKIDFQAY